MQRVGCILCTVLRRESDHTAGSSARNLEKATATFCSLQRHGKFCVCAFSKLNTYMNWRDHYGMCLKKRLSYINLSVCVYVHPCANRQMQIHSLEQVVLVSCVIELGEFNFSREEKMFHVFSVLEQFNCCWCLLESTLTVHRSIWLLCRYFIRWSSNYDKNQAELIKASKVLGWLSFSQWTHYSIWTNLKHAVLNQAKFLNFHCNREVNRMANRTFCKSHLFLWSGNFPILHL